MPKLTIDGVEIEVAPGTTVLQAALSRGAEIPHYCYHPGLSIAGNCRMCLIEVEKAPKLLIGCATQCTDGMVVHTQTEKVKKAHELVMEFLLLNHPLDCTICDQAGECRLQEYAVEYGQGTSRNADPKVMQSKAVDIGKHVMLDQERCIQCSRCTRFCEEVTGTGELAFFQRGQRTIIGIHPDHRLDNPYSGNVVDLCPVGALTLKEFRFQTRVWYLKNTPTICGGCARGCNVMVAVGKQQDLWTTRGQFDDRIKRMVPRVNDAVNGHWMCDEGRLSFKRLEAATRLTNAQSPAGTEQAWEETVERVAGHLKAAAEAGKVAAIFSPRPPTETIYAWKKLLSKMGSAKFGVMRLHEGSDDDLLIRADKGANSVGAEWILGRETDPQSVLAAVDRGEIDTLLVVGDALDPEQTVKLDEGQRSKLQQLVYVGPFLDDAAQKASLLLPAAAWSEEAGSYVNFEGRIQAVRRCHLPRGEGRPGWRIVADLAEQAGVELPAWGSADDVFESLAGDVAAFQGLAAEKLGLLGVEGRAGAAAGS